MAEDPIYKALNFNAQEIRNVSFEKLAAHPTGGGLYEGRFWVLTTDNHVYHYSGGNIIQIPNIEDLNKFGQLVGGHDASGGSVPTQGSGVNSMGSPDLSVEAGDTWRITVGGTISGLSSGDEAVSPGDLLIALSDGATLPSEYMAVQLNLDDDVVDEVRNYADQASFPATGTSGIFYIADDVNEAYIWDGASYKAVSLPNILHYADLGSFPVTGDEDRLYVDDNTNLVYFWDGSSYVNLSGVFSNIFAADGTLTNNRTLSGNSKNLTFTGILALTLSSATYNLVTSGNAEEAIGGNKTVTVTGNSSEASAGKVIESTGAGNNIELVTNTDGALIVPKSANPDSDVVTAVSGMFKYDETDNDFRGYQGAEWRSLLNVDRYADFASLPVTGDLYKMYITDDTDTLYLWDGAAYVAPTSTSLYTADGSFSADRTLDQAGSFFRINSNGTSYFQVDSDNDGIYYDFATQRGGIGVTAPAAVWNVRGKSTDDIFLLETSGGVDVFLMDSDGHVGMGIAPNANYPLYILNTGEQHAIRARGSNNSNSAILGGAEGTTPYGVWGDNSGSNSNRQGGRFTATSATTVTDSTGVYSASRNGTDQTFGSYSIAGENATVDSTNGVFAYYGIAENDRNDDKTGGYFVAQPQTLANVQTGGVFTGAHAEGNAGTGGGSTGTTSVGAKVSAINGVDNNFGLWIENGDLRYDTSVVATAGTVQGQILINIGGVEYYIEVKQ